MEQRQWCSQKAPRRVRQQVQHLAAVEHAVRNGSLRKLSDRREVRPQGKAGTPIDQGWRFARLGAEHHRVPARV